MAGRKKAENKKTMREILDAFLRMPAPESALEEKALLLAQARGAPLDLYEAVVLTQIAKAMKGDTSAAAFVRDSAGDKPTERARPRPPRPFRKTTLPFCASWTRRARWRRWRAQSKARRAGGAPGRPAAGRPKAAGPAHSQRQRARRRRRKFFCPKSHQMGDFLSRRTAAAPKAKKGAAGGLAFVSGKAADFSAVLFLGKGALPLEEKRGTGRGWASFCRR